MSEFDKVIGYEPIKEELLQICDMIHNKEIYETLGAKFPHGILLYGKPGLGKTLMARCFINESNLPAFVIHRGKGSDSFMEEIASTFREAKENAPSVILLDDLDKFSDEDDGVNTKEMTAVQTAIDEVKDSDVFVIATVNEMDNIPRSLSRSGRFDRKIRFDCPTNKDTGKIIAYYLSDKKVSENVNMDDLSRMIRYNSCARLETILNEAAIHAAHKRKQVIEMEDLVKAVLCMQYNSRYDCSECSPEEKRKTALHEAGHLVVAETLCPESVGLASICPISAKATNGFVHRCKDFSREEDQIIACLAGKAAVELYYADGVADGCWQDLSDAFGMIRRGLINDASRGLGMLSVAIACSDVEEVSPSFNARNEAVVQAELERYLFKAKDILLKNRAFLEKTAAALVEKETLLASDIRKIKESTVVTEVAI